MTLLRRGRFLFWLTRDLSRKYKKSLLMGFFVGLISSLILGRIYPFLIQQWFVSIDRVGIVGEFTPTTLPLSVQNRISFGLTSLGSDGSPSAALAESWDATDSGKTYIFHLRPDALWHNGKPVVAEDVNYNIRSVNFQVIDNHTLKATLDDSYSPFPTLVSKPIFQEGLRGFGPYKVASLKLKGDKVQYMRLVPVADSSLKPIEYRFYRTEALAATAFKLGDIDAIEDISSAEQFKHWGQTQIVTKVKNDRIVALYFNLKDQLLGEKTLRQALGYSIPDIKEERAYGPISEASWAYSNKTRHYTIDLDHAKKLLTGAKISSESGSLTITTFSQYVTVAQDIANNWNSIGLPTTVKVANSLDSQYQVLLSAQDVPPDPDQYPFWHSRQTQTNITGYINLKVDKLLEDGRKELDESKRKQIYADFQRFLVEDSPALFLYYPKTYSIYRRKS